MGSNVETFGPSLNHLKICYLAAHNYCNATAALLLDGANLPQLVTYCQETQKPDLNFNGDSISRVPLVNE